MFGDQLPWNPLTPRQNAVALVLLKYYKAFPTQWVTARELASTVNDAYKNIYSVFYFDKMEGFGDGTQPIGAMTLGDFKQKIGCRLSEDIRAMNEAGCLPFLIVSNRTKGYKVATKDELNSFISRSWHEIARKSLYLQALQKRGESDGQLQLDGTVKQAFPGANG